jgi:hypothetical protein
VSEYGGKNGLEIVAESFSEVLGSTNPRPFAVEVYKAVTEQFQKNRRYNRIDPGFSFEAG